MSMSNNAWKRARYHNDPIWRRPIPAFLIWTIFMFAFGYAIGIGKKGG